MNDAMLVIAGMELYRSALVIALGAMACFALTAALYPRGNFGAALWLFACADIVLTVLLCRSCTTTATASSTPPSGAR